MFSLVLFEYMGHILRMRTLLNGSFDGVLDRKWYAASSCSVDKARRTVMCRGMRLDPVCCKMALTELR